MRARKGKQSQKSYFGLVCGGHSQKARNLGQRHTADSCKCKEGKSKTK